MKKTIIAVTLLIMSGSLVHAQHSQTDTARWGTIRGRLADTTAGQVLRQAGITILHFPDSLKVVTALSDNTGKFGVRNLPFGRYILEVSFSGYETRFKNFRLTKDTSALNAGTIYMQLQANNLGNVTVESPPIEIKKDTVEFNANMFATKPNATVEDLLKKLPGIDVDKNGNIKAQGETVQRVTVNGKRFFGDDPKMATENLPADVIDKVQVFDALSDQSAFTGFDDGNRVKTINIITKKNAQHGYFGKVVAGAGDKELYDEAASISHFDGDEQITFIGQGNNTNKQNFTIQDILGTGGGGGGRGGGLGGGGLSGGGGGGGGSTLQSLNANSSNNGLITTWAGGLNYRDVWGKKTDVYGSYFYNNLLTVKDQQTYTQNLIPGDSSINNNQNQGSTTRSVNQRLNLNIETQFDSMNSLIVRPNVSYQQTTASTQAVTNTTRGKLVNLNNSDATTDKYNTGYNGTIDMLFRHRFFKKGRTFSLDVTVGGNENNGNGDNFSKNNYFLNTLDSVTTINQHYNQASNGQSLSTTFSYTEPIGKHSIIELNYNYSYNKSMSNITTYNFDSASNKFTTVDSLLTNNYDNTYYSNRFVLNYRIQSQKLNLSFGNGVQFGYLTSFDQTKDYSLSQHYVNIYPTVNFLYRFSKTRTLRFNYNGRTSQPSVTQLQPLINNADPLNVQIGNPDLKQTFTNSFRMLYSSFDNVHFRNMFATINMSFINNNIVNSVKTNVTTGADTIVPVNLNGTFNLSAYFNYGFPINKPKSNLNFTTNFTDSRSVSLINNVLDVTKNYTIGETFKWTTNLKEHFDINFFATPTYNVALNSLQPQSNENYFSNELDIEGTWFTKKGWILETNFDYISYSGREAGYNTAVPLLNAAFARQLFKNKRGELRLTVFDLLNQNVAISRNVTENYIQDVQTKLLTRYVLLTFTYNIRNFTGQPPQRNRGYYFNRNGGVPPPIPPPSGNGPQSSPGATPPQGPPPE